MTNARANMANMRMTRDDELRGRRRELRQAVHLSASEDRAHLFSRPSPPASGWHVRVREMSGDLGDRRTLSTHVGGLVHDLVRLRDRNNHHPEESEREVTGAERKRTKHRKKTKTYPLGFTLSRPESSEPLGEP